MNKAEIAALAALLQLEPAEFEAYVRVVGIRKSLVEFPNGDCVFFDGDRRTCQVYQARPRQCRTWPFWILNLASPRAWEEISGHCPGCNRGKIVTFEEIESQRNVMRV